ncbi:uncharacterized protein LOC118565554 [Fundulus heteroclitus]|uniref:uncharacterized protein LOC118565554 n=1 Tax=Fundulus heteroclitus TaxID=8078 RepID=UPI00165AB91A|nr:uncharacterized protein LOC118565554 [Fundulus heteroclitus]
MSGPGGAAPPTAVLGLDVSGLWRRGSIQRNTRLLSGSVQPGLRSRAPLRLPALVAAGEGPRRRSSIARLSVSEPSLLSPGQEVPSEGSSGTRRLGVLQIRPPLPVPMSKASTLPSCKNCTPAAGRDQQHLHLQSCGRPAYIQFSQAIRPVLRPGPLRRHSHNPALSSETLLPDQRRRDSSSSQGEALSVVGRPCFLGCSQRPAASAAAAAAGPPGRAQLHVFLPSEAEGEEGDGESVDEGFMDELDSRITSLKPQQEVQQTLANHS